MTLMLFRFDILLQMREQLLQLLDLGKEFLIVLFQLGDLYVLLSDLISETLDDSIQFFDLVVKLHCLFNKLVGLLLKTNNVPVEFLVLISQRSYFTSKILDFSF